jgi:ankyrin repeat protein
MSRTKILKFCALILSLSYAWMPHAISAAPTLSAASCQNYDYDLILQSSSVPVLKPRALDKQGNTCLMRFIIEFNTRHFPPPEAKEVQAVWRAIDNLIKSGVPVDAVSSDGLTALDLAAGGSQNQTFYPELVERLLAHGASILPARPGEDPPLFNFLAQQQRIGLVEIVGDTDKIFGWLISPKLINYQNKEGVSALMRAAQSGRVEWVRKLLALGANPRLKDKNGSSAADYATNGWAVEGLGKETGFYCVARTLLRAGGGFGLEIQKNLSDFDRQMLNKSCEP